MQRSFVIMSAPPGKCKDFDFSSSRPLLAVNPALRGQRRMNESRFNVLFDSISVTSGRWVGDNENG